MIRRTFAVSLVFLVALTSHLSGQIDVTVKTAQTRKVETVLSVTSLESDGVAIGAPVETVGEPVETVGGLASVLFVKTERPIGELLIRVRCKTAKVTKIENGVYSIDTPGTHEVEIDAIGQNPLSWDDEVLTVTVGDGPAPDPIDPDPVDPDRNGLHVLIIYESGNLTTMPAAQQNILYSREVREWLRQNTPDDPDNKKGWRMFDADAEPAAGTLWAKAMERERAQLPWLYIQNGSRVFEGPLPGTVDEFLTKVGEYK